MKPIPIHEAKTHLSRLIERALRGEEVVISRGQEPVVRLVPIKAVTPKREFGAMRGRAGCGPEFFEPLSESDLDAWWGDAGADS